jgi:hypothetical protein
LEGRDLSIGDAWRASQELQSELKESKLDEADFHHHETIWAKKSAQLNELQAKASRCEKRRRMM